MSKNYVAIDIGGTKIAGAIVKVSSSGQSPEIVAMKEIPTDAQEGGQRVLSRATWIAQQLAAETDGIVGCGISSAGVVNPQTGQIVSATNIMPGWAGIELGRSVAEKLGVPTSVINDVHAHALGECAFGAGVGHRDALVVAVGTGIGGAVISEGKLVFGASGLAGHLGHTTYLQGPYLPCSCGRVGHVEAVASGSGVTNLHNYLLERMPVDEKTDQKAQPAQNGFEVYQRATTGDKLAQDALNISARALGQALGNLANCFDPSIIILSGSMTRSGEGWWESLHLGYNEQAMNLVSGVPLVEGQQGGKAPLLGAVAFACERQQEGQTGRG